jgi:hypothetical protein
VLGLVHKPACNADWPAITAECDPWLDLPRARELPSLSKEGCSRAKSTLARATGYSVVAPTSYGDDVQAVLSRRPARPVEENFDAACSLRRAIKA